MIMVVVSSCAVHGGGSSVFAELPPRRSLPSMLEPLEQRVLFSAALRAVTRPTLSPARPAGLSVVVSGGTVTLPSGKSVVVHARTLSFAPPEIRSDTQVVPTPINYNAAAMGGPTLSWQSALPLVPAAAQPFRGGLFHAVLSSSVVVKSANGSRTFISGKDYRLNVEWGQVANLGNRLGKPVTSKVKVSYRYATQRLDLVEVLPNGTL